MPEHDLLSLIENIQSWDKLERKIAELPTEIKRGNAFEEFCHAFFFSIPFLNSRQSIVTMKYHHQ